MTTLAVPYTPVEVHDIYQIVAELRQSQGKWHRFALPVDALALHHLGLLSAFTPAEHFELIPLGKGVLLGRMRPDIRGVVSRVAKEASIRSWLQEDPRVLVADPTSRTYSEVRAKAHGTYLSWAKSREVGELPLSRTAFYRELRGSGYEELKTKGLWVFRGLRFGTPDPLDP